MRRLPNWTRIAAACLLVAAPLAAYADDGHHIFWEIKGRHNTVYLFGSVHMLKAADSELPPEVLRAYQRSASVVMEINLNEAEAPMDSSLESALLPENQELADVLGPALYARFLQRAEPLGLAPEIVARMQPWFAALLLEQMSLTRAGFEAGAGIDMQFTQRAAEDQKPIIGLETVAEQMGIFAQLSLEQQRQYLRLTIEELDSKGADATTVVRAWQRGDTAALEQLLREESARSPELFRMLTTDRNRRWLPRVAALLNDEHDVLVVVGAMHLIGRDGLVDSLRRQGYNPVQH